MEYRELVISYNDKTIDTDDLRKKLDVSRSLVARQRFRVLDMNNNSTTFSIDTKNLLNTQENEENFQFIKKEINELLDISFKNLVDAIKVCKAWKIMGLVSYKFSIDNFRKLNQESRFNTLKKLNEMYRKFLEIQKVADVKYVYKNNMHIKNLQQIDIFKISFLIKMFNAFDNINIKREFFCLNKQFLNALKGFKNSKIKRLDEYMFTKNEIIKRDYIEKYSPFFTTEDFRDIIDNLTIVEKTIKINFNKVIDVYYELSETTAERWYLKEEYNFIKSLEEKYCRIKKFEIVSKQVKSLEVSEDIKENSELTIINESNTVNSVLNNDELEEKDLIETIDLLPEVSKNENASEIILNDDNLINDFKKLFTNLNLFKAKENNANSKKEKVNKKIKSFKENIENNNQKIIKEKNSKIVKTKKELKKKKLDEIELSLNILNQLEELEDYKNIDNKENKIKDIINEIPKEEVQQVVALNKEEEKQEEVQSVVTLNKEEEKQEDVQPVVTLNKEEKQEDIQLVDVLKEEERQEDIQPVVTLNKEEKQEDIQLVDVLKEEKRQEDIQPVNALKEEERQDELQSAVIENNYEINEEEVLDSLVQEIIEEKEEEKQEDIQPVDVLKEEEKQEELQSVITLNKEEEKQEEVQPVVTLNEEEKQEDIQSVDALKEEERQDELQSAVIENNYEINEEEVLDSLVQEIIEEKEEEKQEDIQPIDVLKEEKQEEPQSAVVENNYEINEEEVLDSLVQEIIEEKEEEKQEDIQPIDALKEEEKQEDVQPIDALKEEEKQEDVQLIDALKEEEKQEDVQPIDALKEEEERQEDIQPVDALNKEEEKQEDIQPVDALNKEEEKQEDVQLVDALKEEEERQEDIQPVDTLNEEEKQEVSKINSKVEKRYQNVNKDQEEKISKLLSEEYDEINYNNNVVIKGKETQKHNIIEKQKVIPVIISWMDREEITITRKISNKVLTDFFRKLTAISKKEKRKISLFLITNTNKEVTLDRIKEIKRKIRTNEFDGIFEGAFGGYASFKIDGNDKVKDISSISEINKEKIKILLESPKDTYLLRNTINENITDFIRYEISSRKNNAINYQYLNSIIKKILSYPNIKKQPLRLLPYVEKNSVGIDVLLESQVRSISQLLDYYKAKYDIDSTKIIKINLDRVEDFLYNK